MGKMAMVSWESICRPRRWFGLKAVTTAFMMKLKFKIILDSNAFWVRVLMGKYRIQNGLPETLAQRSGSFLWRGLSKVWSLIRENLLW